MQALSEHTNKSSNVAFSPIPPDMFTFEPLYPSPDSAPANPHEPAYFVN